MRVGKWALSVFVLTLGLFFLFGSASQHTLLRPLELEAYSAPLSDGGQGFAQPVAPAQAEDEDDEEDEDELEYRGVIASLSDSQLVLEDSTTFVINDETKLEEGIAVGSEVEVEATLMALEINADAQAGVNEPDFSGVVASMVLVLDDGKAFLVNGDTEFESAVKVGTNVAIDAVLLALEIESVDEPGGDDDAAEEGDEDGGDEVQHSVVSQKGPTFSGVITSLSDTRLGLNKRLTFVIDDSTQFKGEAGVGAEVAVEFQIRNGLLMARTVEVKAVADRHDEEPAEDSDETAPDELQTDVDNRFFPLPPLTLLVYEGQEEDEGELLDTQVEIRVLPDTEEVAGVEVRVALVEEYEDGELIERTLDLYAQDEDGTVLYMGEFVDEIEDGEVVGHGGQWLAGEGDNLPGIFMPANPQVGDVFEQERAPGIAEDRSEVIETGVNVNVPAGSFSGCIKTEDFDPIGGETEFKFYCPDVGLMREESEEGHLDLVSVGTFDPDELDEDVIEAIGGRDTEGDTRLQHAK